MDDFDTPDSHPSAISRLSTFRVDVPVTCAVIITPRRGPTDASGRLKELREERTLPELGDLDLDVTRRSRHRRVMRTSAHPAPGLCMFPEARTEPLGDLRPDELLQRVLDDREQHVLHPQCCATGGKQGLNDDYTTRFGQS